MAYTAEMSRANPTCFLLLVDQSGSMAERFGGESGKSKAEGVAEAVNRLLQTLVARCAKGEHILDRYYVGVIGYGGEVRLGFSIDALAGEVLQPISRIGAYPLRIEDRHARCRRRRGRLARTADQVPRLVRAKGAGQDAHVCGAPGGQRCARRLPRPIPRVFSADRHQRQRRRGDRRRLRARGAGDLEIGVRGRQRPAVQHPCLRQGRKAGPVPQQRSRSAGRLRPAVVQHVQSVCLPRCSARPASWKPRLAEGARGFAFNADLASVIMFLDIGTRVGGIFGPERTGSA